MGRIAAVPPTPRGARGYGFDFPTLPRMDRSRVSWRLFAECVVGYRDEDLFLSSARWPDRVRTHGHVVDTELARAEQRLLIDAGCLSVRLAGVRGWRDGRYARTLRVDGWIPRPTCPPDDIARDWAELQGYFREHGRDPRECMVAHENFLHLVMTNDPVKAREEQHAAFLKVMSSERGEHYLESVYLFGTPDEVIASLQARVDAGVEYFMLHTMTPDPAQLRHWVDEIIPAVKFPATAGPVRRMAAAVS